MANGLPEKQLEKKFDKFLSNDFKHLKKKVHRMDKTIVKLDAKQKIVLSLLFLILGSIFSFFLWAISFFSSS